MLSEPSRTATGLTYNDVDLIGLECDAFYKDGIC